MAAAHNVRQWRPVVLGGGDYRVAVDLWGKVFCRVFLCDADGKYSPTDHPYSARPEELHMPETA